MTSVTRRRYDRALVGENERCDGNDRNLTKQPLVNSVGHRYLVQVPATRMISSRWHVNSFTIVLALKPFLS